MRGGIHLYGVVDRRPWRVVAKRVERHRAGMEAGRAQFGAVGLVGLTLGVLEAAAGQVTVEALVGGDRGVVLTGVVVRLADEDEVPLGHHRFDRDVLTGPSLRELHPIQGALGDRRPLRHLHPGVLEVGDMRPVILEDQADLVREIRADHRVAEDVAGDRVRLLESHLRHLVVVNRDLAGHASSSRLKWFMVGGSHRIPTGLIGSPSSYSDMAARCPLRCTASS